LIFIQGIIVARLPYIHPNDMPQELAALLATRPPYNVYRLLAHSPPVAQCFIKLAGALLNEGELDPQLRELAILRVGALCESRYEVHQHTRLAKLVGVSNDRIARALHTVGDDATDETDGALLAFTTAYVLHNKVSPSLFDAMKALLSDRQLTELTMTIGFYTMVSKFLENMEVDLEKKDLDISSADFYKVTQ